MFGYMPCSRGDAQKYEDLISFVQDRPGHDLRYAIDPGKLCGELGWKPLENFDTGTHQSLADATNFVRAIIERQGLQMSCIEEISWQKGWIDDAKLRELADGYGKSSYGQYLRRLVEGNVN